SWRRSTRPDTRTTSSSPAGWRSQVSHDAPWVSRSTSRPSSPSDAVRSPYAASCSAVQVKSGRRSIRAPSPRWAYVLVRSNASLTGGGRVVGRGDGRVAGGSGRRRMDDDDGLRRVVGVEEQLDAVRRGCAGRLRLRDRLLLLRPTLEGVAEPEESGGDDAADG